jgi:cytosine/adenosine deaminase-related metal-dependent hydrolase
VATSLIISAARVIPSAEASVIRQGGVLLSGTTVSAVGSVHELRRLAPHARHLDFPDSTILPGLINIHVHLLITPHAQKEW